MKWFLYLNYVVLIVALKWESQISLLCQELNEAGQRAGLRTQTSLPESEEFHGRFEN